MYGRDPYGDGKAIAVGPNGALMPHLIDAALNNRLFYCNTATTVATSTTLNTTFTGLGVCNPQTSGKIHIYHEFGWGIKASVTAEGVLQLAITDDSGIAGTLTVKSAKAGGEMNSSALVFEADTITAPVVCKTVATIDDAAAAVTFTSPPQVLDLKGSILLMPGKTVVTNMTVASGDVFSFHYMWEEINVP